MPLDRRRFLALAGGSLVGALGPRARATPTPPGSLALRVHRETRNTPVARLRALWPDGPTPRRAKPYVGRVRVAFPVAPAAPERSLAQVVEGFAPPDALASSPLALETLGRLLHLTNGITLPGSYPLRAAPSAGALYAGEVYVVAQHVTGLEPGVYSYNAPSHRLVRLAGGAFAGTVAQAVERPAAIERAPLLVLLTNVFYRYAQRYRERGYRYALIDSGHIGENLRLAAAEAGLGVVTVSRYHDQALNTLLAIDGREEAVCALHAVGVPAAVAQLPRVRHLRESGRFDASLREPESYHAATRLVPAVAPASPDPIEAPGSAAAAPPEAAHPDPPAASVSWAIRERRSAERFLDRPVPLADLVYLLGLARGSPRSALSPGVELRIVAHRVADLAPGTYRVSDRDGPTLLAAGDQRQALRAACLGQDKAESAALGVAMLADLGLAARSGDRAYRDQLIQAGAVAQRLYLGAESLGLAARNLAAFYDDDLNALLGVDGKRRAVVHLTMVGAGN